MIKFYSILANLHRIINSEAYYCAGVSQINTEISNLIRIRVWDYQLNEEFWYYE